MSKKYTGWGMAHKTNDVRAIIVVQAKSRGEAVERLHELGFWTSIDKSKLKRVCIVQHPGPKEVQDMKSQSWAKSFGLIKDKDNG